MLTIILGFIITIFVLVFLYENDLDQFSLFILAIFGISSSLYLGIVQPLSGYNEWELLEKTDLVEYSDSGLSNISVLLSDKETFSKVEIQKDSKCTEPALLEFERTAKRTIWTFGLNSETKYVLYVPEDLQIKELQIE